MDTTDPDLTLQQSLEALAGNATSTPNPDTASPPTEPISTTMRRWQRLFALDPDTAISAIQSHRQNLTRARISDEHWATIRVEKEGQGYDREAYEYELEVVRRKATIADPVPAVSDDDGGGGAGGKEGKVAFLVELDGVLVSEEKVAEVAGLSGVPEVVSGQSVEEGRAVRLCCIDGGAKAALLWWAADRGRGWEPTILADPRSLR